MPHSGKGGTVWTKFMDMHSGGRPKDKWKHILINAPMDKAIEIFKKILGHNPYDINCECCGENYSIDENESLHQLTGYERNCKYLTDRYIEESSEERRNPYIPLEDHLKSPDVRLIISE